MRDLGTLASQVVNLAVDSLRPYPNNPRSHSVSQVEALAKRIAKYGWARPIGIDEHKTILFGHGCLEAAKRLGLKHVPTLALAGLSEAKKRALVIADNQLATKSSWDDAALKVHLQELAGINFDMELTGFSMAEIDIRLEASLNPIRKLREDVTSGQSNAESSG